jgi:apolipoprotein N-acyltransferase
MSRHRIFLALFSGVLFTLPFLSFSLGPVAWIALVPLLAALGGRAVREGFLLGLLAGAVWGWGGLYWLHLVTVPGYLVLGLYLALYPALWSGWVVWLSARRPGWVWWAAPAAWTALEYLRTYLFTGFPWNLFGTSQIRNLPLIQISSLTGVYGVGFLLVLVNVAIAQTAVFLRQRTRPRQVILSRPGGIVPAVLLLTAALLYGHNILRTAEEEVPAESLAVTLIQGSIPQELKWVPGLAPGHFQSHLDLSLRARARGSDLLIWPESALPYYLEEQPAVQRRLEDLVARGVSYLLLGGDYRDETGSYNSAYLLSPAGGERRRYDKVHLVPFGEYTPLRSVFPFLGRVVPWDEDFSPGRGYPVFPLAGFSPPREPEPRIGVLICYEDIFPGPSREMVAGGANLLVNITNDAWFGKTPAPFQHFAASVFRAVENRVYLARAANTGYSCVIDPRGRIAGEVVDREGRSLFVPGWTTVPVYPRSRPSFYTEHGDLFSWICVVLALFATLGSRPIRVKRVS